MLQGSNGIAQARLRDIKCFGCFGIMLNFSQFSKVIKLL